MTKKKQAVNQQEEANIQGVVVVPTPSYYVTKSRYTARDKDYGKEHPKGESMTVPGETMTMKEIVKRYQNGIVPDETPVVYMDSEDVASINHYYSRDLDLTDIDNLNANIDYSKQQLAEAEAKLEELRKEKELAKQEETQEPAAPEKPLEEPTKTES